jgi:hypothetical protein
LILGGPQNITVFQNWQTNWCSIKPLEPKYSLGGQYDLLIIDGGRKLILGIEVKISANQVEKAMEQLSAQSEYFRSRHGFVLTPGTACSFDICLYLTPLRQARQFIETCGTQNLLCKR